MTTPNTTTHPDTRFRKLSPDIINKIAGFVAKGNYIKIACQCSGVSEEAYFEWQRMADQDMKLGLTPETSLPMLLVKSVKEAEALQEQVIVERLLSAAMPGVKKTVKKTDADGKVTIEETNTGGEWLAAATYLERRHPDRWARRDKLQVEERKEIKVIVEHYPGELAAGPVVEGAVKELTEGTNEAETDQN